MAYSSIAGWLVGAGCFVLVLIFASTKLMKRYKRMEKRFIDNLNSRENTRLGKNNNLIDDMHQAFIEIDQTTPFVGDRLKDSGLRSDYGVSVSSIQRGDDYMPLPSKDARIFPGDILGVIGNDEQLHALNNDLELAREAGMHAPVTNQKHVELTGVLLTAQSPIINMPLSKTDLLHDFYSMIVKVKRDDVFFDPDPSLVLEKDDMVWVVGDAAYVDKIAGKQSERQ